jgi:hypothetical protein
VVGKNILDAVVSGVRREDLQGDRTRTICRSAFYAINPVVQIVEDHTTTNETEFSGSGSTTNTREAPHWVTAGMEAVRVATYQNPQIMY